MGEIRPPDLEMQVRTVVEHGRTRLRYTLHSHTGAVDVSHHEIAGPVLQGSPEELQNRLLRKLEHMARELDVDGSPLLPEDLDRKLAILGRDLWSQLLPPEIHHRYREIRRSVRSWRIVSDEPWIPWELIKPYDDSLPGEIVDDDFLALRFELTRWLAGSRAPAREIRVSRRAAFRTAKDLPQTHRELRMIDGLGGACQGIADVSPELDSAAELLAFLEAVDLEWLHFAGHGTRMVDQAEESGIPFPDGSVFRPADLEGRVATRIGRCRPLVFLNTCWAGQQGWSFTRLGGWAFRWVSTCGCGALVAPMWPVNDDSALLFARVFYEALADGKTLGQAALAARRRTHQERPGELSALAYAVYGDPHARLLPGGAHDGERGTVMDDLPPLIRTWRRRSRLRRYRRWIGPAAAACGLAAVLHVSAPSLLNLLFPFDQPPQQTAMSLKPRPASEPVPTKPKTEPAASAAVGGLRFEIAGGQASVRYALKQALIHAAKPLTEEGISGWTIILMLDRPRIEQHTLDGVAMDACRLTAEARAERPGSRIDLGPISVVNSQFDSAQACEGAAGSLAEGVLARLVAALRTKGET